MRKLWPNMRIDCTSLPGSKMANRVQYLICVFVLIAGAGLATETNDGVVLSRGQPLAWIRTSADKTHFVCDGTDHPFVPWGFNYDHDDAGRFLEYYWADDWAKVTNDFREMKVLGANVVRVSPQLCCLMKSPGQPDRDKPRTPGQAGAVGGRERTLPGCNRAWLLPQG